MTAKKKPARVPRTTVTGWGVLLLPLCDEDKPDLLTQMDHDDIQIPYKVRGGCPLLFGKKKDAVAWWTQHRSNAAWRQKWKVRIVRITGTYEEAK